MDKITPQFIQAMKGKTVIPALTAYDYPMTRLLDEAGVPLLLVGDSLGMVMLGYPDTTEVTMQDMLHHVRAAARAKPKALLAADMPYRSYESIPDSVAHAQQLAQAGAEAVKAEGGLKIIGQVKAIVDAGIPYIGHLGMLPQSVKEEGGYHKKGKSTEEHDRLIADAIALEKAGAFALVLELVIPEVTREITRALKIPTIGIGSGPYCDGQILVTLDLWGVFPWFTPRFVKPKVQGAELYRQAVNAWITEISGNYSSP